MAAMSGVPSVTIFQMARDRIEQDIGGIIQSLNNKQTELFGDITRLEKEFEDKQQQKLKDLSKLASVKAKTEEELGENSLIEIQQKVIWELQIGINKLSLEIESCREPDYKIETEWGICFTTLFSNIDKTKITATSPLLQRKRKGSKKLKKTRWGNLSIELPPSDWRDTEWTDSLPENDTPEFVDPWAD